MRLRAKLTAAFLLVACIVWAVGLVDLVFYIRSTRELRQLTERTAPTLVALDHLKISAFRMMLESIGVGLLRMHGNREHRSAAGIDAFQDKRQEVERQDQGDNVATEERELREAFEACREWLDKLERVSTTGAQQQRYVELSQTIDKVYQLTDRLSRLPLSDDYLAKAISIKNDMEDLEASFVKSIQTAINAERDSLSATSESVNRAAVLAGVTKLLAISVSAVLAVTLGLLLARGISAPVLRLRDAAVELGKGNREIRVETTPANEIGDLACAFNKMAEDLAVSRSYLENIVVGEKPATETADQIPPSTTRTLQDLSRPTESCGQGLAVFDEAGALVYAGGDQALLHDVAELFLDDVPNLLADIRTAIEDHDSVTVETCAHRIKGAAGNLGARLTREAAEALETAGRERDLGCADRALAVLEHELGRFRRGFRACVTGDTS